MADSSMTRNNPVILITGGTGFAGTHLVEYLLSQKERNIHVTSHSGRDNFLGDLIPKENIHKLDLSNQKEVEDLIKNLQPDHVYHLASISTVENSFEKMREIMQNNIDLQINVLDAIKKFSKESKVLVITSAEQYKKSEEKLSETSAIEPNNPYAVSKATQDMLAYVYSVLGLKIIRARPFNHIGERQKTNFAVPAFASQIAKIEKNQQDILKVGNLEAIRDFTDVKDMVRAYHLLMTKGEIGEVYNIGSGFGIKVKDVLEKLTRMAKVKIHVVEDPARMRPVDNHFIVADNSKIVALGWHPTIPIDQTLTRTLNYFRSQT
ncbi:GDP-mannose 4,6-dehydratase [Patescibacteria group bacterium]|nr:GDP-mannose 4,6-dehydratase [Patescibacteria group bacterium]